MSKPMRGRKQWTLGQLFGPAATPAPTKPLRERQNGESCRECLHYCPYRTDDANGLCSLRIDNLDLFPGSTVAASAWCANFRRGPVYAVHD